MMARSSKAPSIGRIQKRKTNFSKSSFSTCNARPVHTDGPDLDIRAQRLLRFLALRSPEKGGNHSVVAGLSGINSSKVVPTGDIGRVSLALNCLEGALTKRVPSRLLIVGSKSTGRPTPSSRTDTKIVCLSVCNTLTHETCRPRSNWQKCGQADDCFMRFRRSLD
jgi:hypothetical protein